MLSRGKWSSVLINGIFIHCEAEIIKEYPYQFVIALGSIGLALDKVGHCKCYSRSNLESFVEVGFACIGENFYLEVALRYASCPKRLVIALLSTMSCSCRND
ncbi:unnamed protein product [Lupinus luteus]|uniref:Uncharacterized protein n=1 Tax=Lupinus luteus TaxID=3873 RepID=A0AAV1X902_LUPLU